jgi:hypothetical protein
VKRIVKPNQLTDLSSIRSPRVEDPALSDISVARLIDDGLLAIYREMKNLLILSASGKLDSASSKDLRDTVKLLFELKDRENESLRGISDEDLEATIKDIKSDKNV